MNIFGQGWNPWGNWESQGSKAAPDALRTQGTNNQVTVEVTEGVSLSDLRVGQTFSVRFRILQHRMLQYYWRISSYCTQD